MDGSAHESPAPRPITAALTYVIDTGEKPVFKASVGGGDANEYTAQFEAREVRIQDGRATPGGFGLDREGFVLVEHETAVSDFYDETQVEGLYDAEIEALIKEATGASRVVIFDHTLRSDARATQVERNIREPASIVHNDYSPRSAPRRVRDILPAEEAEVLLRGRFAIVNVWRSVAGPVSTSPLALCDARSVAPADLILSERRSKERVGEIQQAVFNPDHRWFYFPDMRRNEALLIKTYDSQEDGRARFTIHTAFDNPAAPADATPRESIETRVFVFF